MKVYRLSTIFTFGWHKGKTLEQVLKNDFQYIDWCLREIKDFVVDDSQLGFITVRYGRFSYEAFKAQKGKWEQYNRRFFEEGQDDYWRNNPDNMDEIDWEAETFEAITGGQLGDLEDFPGTLDDAFTAMGLD